MKMNFKSSLLWASFVSMLWLLPSSAIASYRYRLILSGKPDSHVCPLSQRSLDRRVRQGIGIDSTDFVVSPTYLSLLEQAGLRICSRSRWLNSVVVMTPDGGAITDADYWSAFPFVERVVEVTSTEAGMAPALRPDKWRVAADSATDVSSAAVAPDFRRPMQDVNGQALYDAGYRGRDMLIAVLDGGFTNANTIDWLSSKVVGCRDMYASDDTLTLYASDKHGAQVLSLMAADSVHGIWGTACEASYYLIRTEYSPSESPFEEDQWVAGAELADSLGVDLINSSLGYSTFNNSSYNHDKSELSRLTAWISRGAEMAAGKGILVCSAAGNERQSAWQTLNFPSDAPSIFTVGATDDHLSPAYFTSPGFLSPYVKPDVACRGRDAYVVDTGTGGVTCNSGTSFSSPFMCGLAASLWQSAPLLTATQIREVIRESASQYAAPDSLLGYGLPDFAVALAQAQLLQSSINGIVEVSAEDVNSVSSPRRGLYDLLGRRLRHAPEHGCYVEDGKVKYKY